MGKKLYQPEYTDLRSVTRYSDQCETTVYLFDKMGVDSFKWLHFGQANLDSHDRKKTHTLKAYLAGATDFEHDSAHALQLPLIGLTFEHLFYHRVCFLAWIAPDAGPDPDGRWADFHVPRPGYDPRKHEDAEECTVCETKHIVVPEGFYLPPFDNELYQAVKGRRVEVRIGPAPRREED